ncbi:DUF4294 domain-containing protein [Flavobacteriales bacterium]|nr:DUF4294 domain-containing protein [Flavobacteriales bacterium]
MKFILIFFLGLVTTFSSFSQIRKTDPPEDTTKNKALYIIENGDTIPVFILREFNYTDPDFAREWNRTVFFAKRMYTYAKIIDSIVEIQDAELAEIERNGSKKRRKSKRTNKDLKKTLWDEYSYEIKNLTNTRGDYLTRLIHRETGSTAFELIKKYKNGRTAFFWNSVLWSFGSTNLKNKFDAKEDWMLKLVVEDIEAGKIKPYTRAQLIQEMKAREVRDKARKKRKK